MTMKVSDIASFMDRIAPPNLAEYWDNVGLLVGNREQNVSRILVSLDATMETVNEAIQKKADMIITHHPVIFKELKSLNEDDFKVRMLAELIRNNISVYCAHTNLDVAEDGVNEQLADILGLVKIKNFNSHAEDSWKKLQKPYPGKVGLLGEAMNFEDFIYMVKVQLEVPYLRVIGKEKEKIQKVAVFCGSFDENWEAIMHEAPDVLVTGDIKYHTALDAFERGICIIDAGHFATEKVIIPVIVKKLQESFPTIEVVRNYMEKDPIKII